MKNRWDYICRKTRNSYPLLNKICVWLESK